MEYGDDVIVIALPCNMDVVTIAPFGLNNVIPITLFGFINDMRNERGIV